MHRCTGPTGQKSITLGKIRSLATRTNCRVSSETPSFLAALMGTTGTPKALDIFWISTEPPLPVSSSIILRATTVGMRSSSSCKVRYKFRSMLVASTMLMIPSGLPPSTKSRVTISS